MARTEARTTATRDAVWAVFADGWHYTNWVVGASHMRAVDARWPEVGSKLHHSAGMWPILLKDETEVVAVEPRRRIELIARGRPLGQARIVLTIEDDPAGCLVTIDEKPIKGPGSWLDNPAAEAVLRRRNEESMARLVALCERRTEPKQ
jgi:hypothetical protein